MTERALRPSNVGAGAVLIGGILLVALPDHAVTIAQLVIVTVAVSAAVYALAANVPQAGWISPFKWLSPFDVAAHRGRRDHTSGELRLIRNKFSSRRQRIDDRFAVPPSILRQLRPLVMTALDLGQRDEKGIVAARDSVCPETYAVLVTEPLRRPTWFATERPDAASVTVFVEAVLDDLERLNLRTTDPLQPAIPISPDPEDTT